MKNPFQSEHDEIVRNCAHEIYRRGLETQMAGEFFIQSSPQKMLSGKLGVTVLAYGIDDGRYRTYAFALEMMRKSGATVWAKAQHHDAWVILASGDIAPKEKMTYVYRSIIDHEKEEVRVIGPVRTISHDALLSLDAKLPEMGFGLYGMGKKKDMN